jgi:hypothetical protein
MKIKIANDKLLHFSFSCIGFLILNIIFNPVLSAISMFLIGFIKEIDDDVYGTGFSWGDIIANTIGIIFAGIIIGARLLLK